MTMSMFVFNNNVKFIGIFLRVNRYKINFKRIAELG